MPLTGGLLKDGQPPCVRSCVLIGVKIGIVDMTMMLHTPPNVANASNKNKKARHRYRDPLLSPENSTNFL